MLVGSRVALKRRLSVVFEREKIWKKLLTKVVTKEDLAAPKLALDIVKKANFFLGENVFAQMDSCSAQNLFQNSGDPQRVCASEEASQSGRTS